MKYMIQWNNQTTEDKLKSKYQEDNNFKII